MKKAIGSILIFLGIVVIGFGAWLLMQGRFSEILFCISVIGFGVALIGSGFLVYSGRSFWKTIEDMFYTLP